MQLGKISDFFVAELPRPANAGRGQTVLTSKITNFTQLLIRKF